MAERDQLRSELGGADARQSSDRQRVAFRQLVRREQPESRSVKEDASRRHGRAGCVRFLDRRGGCKCGRLAKMLTITSYGLVAGWLCPVSGQAWVEGGRSMRGIEGRRGGVSE